MALSNKIKFFKQLAILMSIIWTIACYIFVAYQMNNERKHIYQNSIAKAATSTKQASQLIAWAFDQKAKSAQQQRRLEMKSDFSLRDLIYHMAKEEGSKIRIETNYLESDLLDMDNSVKNTIRSSQIRKKDGYTFFTQEDGGEYLFYFKPLLAEQSCIECHIHDDKHVGDLLGSVNIIQKVPTLQEYNPYTFYFLITTYFITWIIGLSAIWWIRYKSKTYFDEKMQSYEESIYHLVTVMEKRDSYTAGHSKRVAYYASLIAKKMELSKDEIDQIYKAGMLHDIGKIEIPDALLLKPAPLSGGEYEIVKKHSKSGYELLNREPFSQLAKIVLHHHERYDGKGYPNGFRGYQIPLLSQILAVADTYDAITTNRAYRKASNKEEAFAILDKCKGNQLNPEIVEIAKEILEDIELPESLMDLPDQMLDEMQFTYYFRDSLTGHYNVNFLKFMLAHKSDYSMICTYHMNCVNFAAFNKIYGWKKGDEFIQKIADALHECHPSSYIIRLFGDNFMILHTNEHIEIDIHVLDHLLDGKNMKLEFKHLNLTQEGVDSLDKLEDILSNTSVIKDEGIH